MKKKFTLTLVAAALALSAASFAQAGGGVRVGIGIGIPLYAPYPHYYYPHNYWPTQGPRWPERPGEPYMKPPAYMTYPPFEEPHWRYEWFQPQRYYRGFHFWLDQF